MSKADDTTMNWEPYEAEILSICRPKSDFGGHNGPHEGYIWSVCNVRAAPLCRVEASTNSTVVKSNTRPNSQVTKIWKLQSGFQLPSKYENGPWKAGIAMYIFTADDLTRNESRERWSVINQGFPTQIPRQVTIFPVMALFRIDCWQLNKVIGTSAQDRIYIRTPPASFASSCPSQASVTQHGLWCENFWEWIYKC